MSTRDLTSPSAIAVIAGAGLLCILLRASSASGLKITRKQLERIVAEKKARLQEAGPSWLDDEGSVQVRLFARRFRIHCGTSGSYPEGMCMCCGNLC